MFFVLIVHKDYINQLKRCPMCRTSYDHFNNVSIDKNNVLVRSSEKVKKLDEKRNFNQYLRERENNPIILKIQ